MVLVSSPSATVSDANARIARALAHKAEISRDAGEVVRPYLLFDEAAKRDPNVPKYRLERDLLAPTAKLLLKTKLESSKIKKDVADAEREAASGFELAYPEEEASNAPAPPEPSLKVRGEDFQTPAGTQSPNGPPQTSNPPPNGSPLPQGDDPQRDKVNPWNLTFGTQILGYGTYDGIRSDSLFNPDNELAELPKEDFHADLRSDLKLTSSRLSFSAKPRVDYEHSLEASSHNVAYYLQEWSARLQILSSLTASYGREVPMWGPAMSVPASNPWFRDNGRNTPLLEIGARDFGRLVWQPASRFAVSYIANTALRRGTPDFLPFRPTAALKADYIGHSILLSGIYSNFISSPLGRRKFVGGYFQSTIGQAFRLYAEGSAQEGNPAYYPDTSVTEGLAIYSQSRLDNALKPRTIVGGAAYTDPKGGTWTGEYIYNPFGYSDMVSTAFYQNAQSLSQVYVSGSPYASLAAQQLSLAANPGLTLLRNYYAFGQYQRNALLRNVDVVLRYTLNIQDHGGQGVAYVTWNTSDHFQLFAVFAGFDGSLETEFARYLHYQAQLGFRVFLH